MKKIALIFIILPCLSWGLTFKKDGSIISSSGEIKRESNAVRYQRALEQYNKGEEVKDWPVVKETDSGKTYGQQGYFGEKILDVGAPLLSIQNLRGVPKNKIIDELAIQNGFDDTKLLNISIILNSNEDFRDDNSISDEDFLDIKENFSELLAIDPSTGVAPLPLNDKSFGGLKNDSTIDIDGIELTDSLETIAEKLDLDSSIVTSRAIAETLSSVSENISTEISSDPTSDPGYQAIDPETGEAPKP